MPKTAKKLLAKMSSEDLITQIAFMLECAVQHSDCPHSWGVPSDDALLDFQKECGKDEDVEVREREFYYAYSHVSFVCACLWAQHIDDSVDAELFTNLMNNQPKNMRKAVKELLLDANGNPTEVGP